MKKAIIVIIVSFVSVIAATFLLGFLLYGNYYW